MAEEQRLQEQGSHTLCANNCGFFGSPTTLNLCSKCYKDFCLKEQQMKDAQLAVEISLSQAKSSIMPSDLSSSSSSASAEIVLHNARVESKKALPEEEEEKEKEKEKEKENGVVRNNANQIAAVAASPAVQPNRCSTCRRRVGITGFKCRCGATFCGTHRYPEKHGCTFDYKSIGRDAIAKANPIIKAEKLDKI